MRSRFNTPAPGKHQVIAQWWQRKAIALPVSNGRIVECMILSLVECNSFNGLPLDAYIRGAFQRGRGTLEFGVFFSPDIDLTPRDIDVLVLPSERDDSGGWWLRRRKA